MRILFTLDPWIYRDSIASHSYVLEKMFIPTITNLVRYGHDVALFLGEDMYDYIIAKELKIDCVIKRVPLKDLYRAYDNHYDAHKLQFEETNSMMQKRVFKNLIKDIFGLWYPNVIISFTTPVSVWKECYPKALSMQFENGIFSRTPYPHLCQLDQFGFLKKSYPYIFLKQLRNRKITARQLERLLGLRDSYRKHIFNKINPFSADEIRDYPGQKVLLVPLSYNGVIINDAASAFRGQLDVLLKTIYSTPKNTIILYTKHSLQTKGEIPEETEVYLLNKFKNLRYLKKSDQYAFSSQWLTPHVDAIVSVNSTVAYHGAFWGKKVFALGKCEINSVSTADNLCDIESFLNTKDMDDLKSMNVIYHLLTRYCFSLNLWLDAEWLTERFVILMTLKKNGLLESRFDVMPLVQDDDAVFDRLLREAPGMAKDFYPRIR